MPGFNLDTLLDFHPPSHLCEKCCAIDEPALEDYDEDDTPSCAICNVTYLPTRSYKSWNIDRYLSREGRCGISFKDALGQGTKLARLARNLRSETPRLSPMGTLNELFLAAEQFIHFLSWGINHTFIGSLKLASHRVPVRGIVSNVNDRFAVSELLDYADESPSFRCEILVHPGDARARVENSGRAESN